MIDLEKFAAFLRKTNKSANTVASYCFAARQYTTHFGEFTKKNLLLYKAFLMERFKPKTVNIRLLAMNAYATCIGKPTLKMPLIRIQQKPFLENVISDADYAYFKRKLNNPAERYWYFTIRFLAATGARISELLQLKVEHVTAGHIDIYSKGGKMRRIYIPQKLINEYQEKIQKERRTTVEEECQRLQDSMEPVDVDSTGETEPDVMVNMLLNQKPGGPKIFYSRDNV